MSREELDVHVTEKQSTHLASYPLISRQTIDLRKYGHIYIKAVTVMTVDLNVDDIVVQIMFS